MNWFCRRLGFKWSGLKINRLGSRQYRMERKFLFMRCICTGLGKVTRAWIWLQTIIKCGDNERGYTSKPLHVWWAFKGPLRKNSILWARRQDLNAVHWRFNCESSLFFQTVTNQHVSKKFTFKPPNSDTWRHKATWLYHLPQSTPATLCCYINNQ
jgi:hypothetical protein